MRIIPSLSSILLLFSLASAVPPVSADSAVYHAQVALQRLGYRPGPAGSWFGHHGEPEPCDKGSDQEVAQAQPLLTAAW